MNLQKLLLVALLLVSPLANAATFDFLAAGNANEQGYSTYSLTDSGITVYAGGTSVDGASDYYAYLDSGNAGLGVCQVLTSDNQCSPSSDDNVTFGETLHLAFSEMVTITETTFVNGNHGASFLGDFDLSIDGGAATTYSLTNIFTLDLVGTHFDFSNLNSQGGSNVSNMYQFYISNLEVSGVTAVPVPAALLLFLSGLLPFGLLRRKARK